MDGLQTVLSTEMRDNWKLFLGINGLAGHSAPLDSAMIFSANDLLFALPVVLLVVWLLLARWSPFSRWLARRADASTAEGDRWLGQRALLAGVLGVGLSLGLTLLVGALIFEPRPFISHPSAAHKLIAHPADASFPSDHETVAMAIALALIFYAVWLLIHITRERVRQGSQRRNANLDLKRAPWLGRTAPALIAAALALVIAVTIGFARIYVGVHYPVDIAGGAVSGFVGDAIAFALMPLAQQVYRPLVRLATVLRLA